MPGKKMREERITERRGSKVYVSHSRRSKKKRIRKVAFSKERKKNEVEKSRSYTTLLRGGKKRKEKRKKRSKTIGGEMDTRKRRGLGN